MATGADQTAPRWAPGIRAATPRLVFATFALGSPTAALQQAQAMAAISEAELHVLGVLPVLRTARPTLSSRSFDDGAAAVNFFRAASERLREWVARVVPGLPVAERVVIEEGDFADVVARAAREQHARMVVVPARPNDQGRRIAKIAVTAGVPVLVAGNNSSGESRTIVAATDLADPTYPVLRQACHLGERLGKHVYLVHNVESATSGSIDSWLPVKAPGRERGRAFLQAFCRHTAPAAALIVLETPSTAEAILITARERDADLIVVGVSDRPWLRTLFSRGTAVEVVNGADRSVLVTPLPRRQNGSGQRVWPAGRALAEGRR